MSSRDFTIVLAIGLAGRMLAIAPKLRTLHLPATSRTTTPRSRWPFPTACWILTRAARVGLSFTGLAHILAIPEPYLWRPQVIRWCRRTAGVAV